MSRLEELIREHCPDGVDFYELREIFDLKNGYTPSKSNPSFWKKGTVPWFRMEDIRENGRILSDSLQHITLEAVKGNLFPANSIIVATSATIGEHALITVASLANQRFTYLTRKKEFVERVDPMFAFYYCFKLDQWCLENTNISSFESVDMTRFVRFKMPLPPLPVQSEIVRILDSFSALTAKLSAELHAELTARKKQYEYYRDLLLTFGDIDRTLLTERNGTRRIAVQWIALGDIAKFTYGFTDKAKDYGTARFIRITDIDDNGCLSPSDGKYVDLSDENQKYRLRKGDLLVARTGATYGKTLYVPSDDPAVFASFLIKISLNNEQILNRYYWHFSKSTCYWRQAENLVSAGGQPQFNSNALCRINVPVPPLEEQERIVAILDRFDALCNSLTSGLPAEIEARRRQYEYYRDRLLMFKELAVA